MIPDWANRWVPPPNVQPWVPSTIDPYPFTVEPTPQPVHWTKQMVLEFEELIRRVKELEEKVAGQEGTPPCFNDPHKLEFLEQIKAQLDRIEAKQEGSSGQNEG